MNRVLDFLSLKQRLPFLLFIIAFLLFEPYLATAQQKSVSGTVKDDQGSPLAAVSVVVKGTSAGVTTDDKGMFTVNTRHGATLEFSLVNYKTVSIVVGNKNAYDIVLLPADIRELENVVVVGYGTSKKKDLTGSVASVALNDQEKTPVLGTEQLLQGRVSGVQVSQNQSQPGAVFSVRIRGTNSINSGSSPLFVIDGYAGANVGDINPSDILSMDVLKDASATAIYGSRGANGVVIITTKRGSSASRVTVDAYTGVQKVGKLYKLMNGGQFGNYLNTLRTELNEMNNVNDPLPYTQEQIDEAGKGTDWQDAIFRSAQISNYSVAVSGGDADTKSYLSFNYFDQKGIIIGSDYKRGIVRYNLDQNIGQKFKIGASSQLAYSYQNMTTVNTSGGADQPSVLWDAVRFNPILPVKDANNAYTYVNGPAGLSLPLGNPVAYLENAKGGAYRLNAFANVYGEYEIIKDLRFRTSFGVNYIAGGNESFTPSFLFASSGVGRASQSSDRNYNYLSENVLTYNKDINENNVINLTGGFTFQRWYNKSFSAGATNLSTDILGVNNLAVGQPLVPSSSFTDNALASYFARANYQLMDKYLFTFTIRADGSSRFGENDKWGYFPSGAFAWRVSEENFIKKIKTISDLKFRISYGVTGNQEIGSYNSLSRYANTSYALGVNPAVVPGIFAANIANPDLKWESTSSADIGLDLGLWDNRLSITADYYAKKTSDLLLNVTIPITSGYASILQNAGEVSNKGFEFSATSLNIDRTNLKWSTTLNFSTNKNKVLNLGTNKEIYVGALSGALFNGGGTSSILRPGHPIGSFYGYVFDGIWQTTEQISQSGTIQDVRPGDPNYRDLDNDKNISGGDRMIVGQALPKFIYGMTNNLTVGRFNLNVFLQGVYGNKIFNENLYEIENGIPGFNKLAYVATDSWHGNGTTNTQARVSSTLRNALGLTSDVLENGSFLRVKSVTVSYDIVTSPTRIFKSANVYLTGQNLLTVTKYSGYDPEVNSSTDASDALTLGTDYNAYPNYRTFLVGVKFGF